MSTESEWHIVEAVEGQPWPCTLVDRTGKSLLGVHNGTPIIRDRSLSDRLLLALNSDPNEAVCAAPSPVDHHQPAARAAEEEPMSEQARDALVARHPWWQIIEDALRRHDDQLRDTPLHVEHHGSTDAVLAALAAEVQWEPCPVDACSGVVRGQACPTQVSLGAPTQAEVGALLSAVFHALGTHALSGHTGDLEHRLRGALSGILASRLCPARAAVPSEGKDGR